MFYTTSFYIKLANNGAGSNLLWVGGVVNGKHDCKLCLTVVLYYNIALHVIMFVYINK